MGFSGMGGPPLNKIRRTGFSGTGVPPVHPVNHGRDGRATEEPVHPSNHGRATEDPVHPSKHGRATESCAGEGLLRIREGAYLPHWTLDGATYFVTFRLGDALPESVLAAWFKEKAAIQGRTGDPKHPLSDEERSRLMYLASEKVEAALDAGHGSCCLREPGAAEVVQGALRHFDGGRYDLLVWAVMPNHVHVVIQPKPGHNLPDIVHSWKSFTAHKVSALLRRSGELWQPEYYDHLIRDDADLARCVEYTLGNPERAGLADWPWCGVSRSMGSSVARPLVARASRP
jgi:REP element-mobilizing transposase RayT